MIRSDGKLRRPLLKHGQPRRARSRSSSPSSSSIVVQGLDVGRLTDARVFINEFRDESNSTSTQRAAHTYYRVIFSAGLTPLKVERSARHHHEAQPLHLETWHRFSEFEELHSRVSVELGTATSFAPTKLFVYTQAAKQRRAASLRHALEQMLDAAGDRGMPSHLAAFLGVKPALAAMCAQSEAARAEARAATHTQPWRLDPVKETSFNGAQIQAIIGQLSRGALEGLVLRCVASGAVAVAELHAAAAAAPPPTLS